MSKSIVLVLIITMFSCSSSEVSETDMLIREKLTAIDERIINGGLNTIIIPGEGCGGCISQITGDLISGIDTLNSNVVFTGIGDKKLLKNQLGKSVTEHSLVYFDYENILMDTRISSIYPQIVIITKNKLIIKSLYFNYWNFVFNSSRYG